MIIFLNKRTKTVFTLSIALSILSTNLSAEVITDGSTGIKTNVQGPNFLIPETLGIKAGNNLYHSFQSFNLQNTESATFTGNQSIKNVISRITGGELSTIDGKISSSIGSQGFYFINPAGIIFGNNASIDVPSSFYTSTANQLSFTNGEQFSTNLSDASTFSSASPEAFGFTAKANSKIVISGSTLELQSGQQFSIIASELDINSAAEQSSRLTTNQGQIYLVSAGTKYSTSDNTIVPIRFTANNSEQYSGDITINQTNFDVRGDGGGTVVIQGGDISLTNSNIIANNNGNLSTSNQIKISANSLLMDSDSSLIADTLAAGKGVDINIDVNEEFKMRNKSDISLKTVIDSSGNSGNIVINAGQFILNDGAHISSSTVSSGNAGNIKIIADDVSLDGFNHNGRGAGVEISSTSLSYAKAKNVDGKHQVVEYQAQGNAGNITIETQQLEVVNSATIITSTFAKGEAGKIKIDAKNINIDTGGYVGDLTEAQPEPLHTGIYSSSGVYNPSPIPIFEDGELVFKEVYIAATGNAGEVILNAETIKINKGGQVSVTTSAIGNAGSIAINAENLSIDHQDFYFQQDNADSKLTINSWLTGLVSISQNLSTGNAGDISLNVKQLDITDAGALISSQSFTTGQAGSVDINAEDIYLKNAALISVVGQDNTASNSTLTPTILIQTDNLTLSQLSNISAQSKGTASGGKIVIKAKENIALNSLSQISSEAENSDSGSINIDSNSILLDDGFLLSSVGRLVDGTPIIKGDAGDISVKSDSLIMSDSYIQANTQGIGDHGGAIIIDSKQVVTAYGTLEVGGGAPVDFEPDSGRNIIQAASPQGAPGTIIITSPIDNVTSIIQAIDSSFKSLAKISKNPCQQKLGEETSSLILSGRGALPSNSSDTIELSVPATMKENSSLYDLKTSQLTIAAASNSQTGNCRPTTVSSN